MASELKVNTEVNKLFQSVTSFIINDLNVNINDNVIKPPISFGGKIIFSQEWLDWPNGTLATDGRVCG
jgi:hypothetical protein